MRQHYETDSDLERERLVAQSVAQAKGGTFHKVPSQYAEFCDYAFAKNNKIACYAEIKVRNMKWDPMNHVVLSCRKWHNGISFSTSLQLPWMLVICVREGIYGVMHRPNFKPQAYRQEFGGRVASQRDEGDIEPVVCIPTGDFKKLAETPTGVFKPLPHQS